MKKSLKLFAFAILAGLAFSTASCSKCRTCELVYGDGNILSSTEVCNDKDAMGQQKTDCNTMADANVNLECRCSVAFSF